MAKKQKNTGQSDEIVLFQVVSDDATCSECREPIYRGDLLKKEGEQALCRYCAELDHLLFLPSGNTALTRRAGRHTGARIIVVRFARRRRRYERQGILVTPEALSKAEAECLSDEDARARARERAAKRRATLDAEYVDEFARRVREMFPCAPEGRDIEIAEHACLKYSNRVGRSAAAKEFAPKTIELAVRAHIRHRATNYDEIILRTQNREEARRAVRPSVDRIYYEWAHTDDRTL